MEEYKKEILNLLNVNSNDICFDDITYNELLDATKNGKQMYKGINFTNRKPFNTKMRKVFPEKEEVSVLWYTYILSLCDFALCSTCGNVLKNKYFRKRGDLFKSSCKKCQKIKDRCYRENNKETIIRNRAKYYLNNKDSITAYNIRYRKEHPEKSRELVSRRRAAKLNATPPWYEKDLVTELYKQSSKETHIDHIIPLQNRLVCGLHCISNLQAIPAEDNLSKFNKFDPDRIETLIMKELCNT